MEVDFRKIAEDSIYNVKCEENGRNNKLSDGEIKEIEDYLKSILVNGSLLEGIVRVTSMEEEINGKRK